MTKRFNSEYLHKLCYNKEIQLIGNYTDQTLFSQSLINFKCTNCNEYTSKQFINIEKYNGLCKNCSCYSSKNRIKYNLSFLNKLSEEKKFVITQDYSVKTINSTTQIEFKCIECNKITSKRFQYIQKYDAKCNDCSNKSGKLKANQTILDRYGVSNISQL
jgi:hypothetical protein